MSLGWKSVIIPVTTEKCGNVRCTEFPYVLRITGLDGRMRRPVICVCSRLLFSLGEFFCIFQPTAFLLQPTAFVFRLTLPTFNKPFPATAGIRFQPKRRHRTLINNPPLTTLAPDQRVTRKCIGLKKKNKPKKQTA